MQTFIDSNATAKNPACVAQCFFRLVEHKAALDFSKAETDCFYLMEHESPAVAFAFVKSWMLKAIWLKTVDEKDKEEFHSSVRTAIRTLLCQPVVSELIIRAGGFEKLCEEE